MYKIFSDRILPDISNTKGYILPIAVGITSDTRTHYDMCDFWKKHTPTPKDIDFDTWRQLLAKEDEYTYCTQLISEAIKTKKPIHIANISNREVVEDIVQYYHDCGYFSDYPRKCIIPDTALITVSVSLNSLCYSEKEKNADIYKYIDIYPPIRSSSEQKYFTTMIRTGVIHHIDTQYQRVKHNVQKLITEEILSPFLLGAMLYYRIQSC